mgnify:CR=1 FL=1
MLQFDIKKRSEYKFRIYMSLGVLLFIGLAALRTGIIGPGFWEIVFIGLCFALTLIAHSLWAIGAIDRVNK